VRYRQLLARGGGWRAGVVECGRSAHTTCEPITVLSRWLHQHHHQRQQQQRHCDVYCDAPAAGRSDVITTTCRRRAKCQNHRIILAGTRGLPELANFNPPLSDSGVDPQFFTFADGFASVILRGGCIYDSTSVRRPFDCLSKVINSDITHQWPLTD